MDISNLIRDPSRIHSDWVKTADKKIVTRSGCKVYIPRRYSEKGLATIGNEIYTLGIFGVVVADKYLGVSLVNAKMRLDPSTINVVSVGGEEYVEFVFDPGSVVIANANVVKDNKLPYYIFNEFMAKGHIPWFMSYLDLGRLFAETRKYTGLNLRTNYAILEMIAAVLARDPAVRTDYFRHSLKNAAELANKRPTYIAFRNISQQATNTTSKLLGSYFREGLTSALVNPSERREGIEQLLRA